MKATLAALALCFVLNLSARASAPALVQQKTAGGGASPLTVTLDTAPASGDSLIALVGHNSSRTLSTISGGGVTWTQGAVMAPGSGGVTVDIWYGHNSSGSGTAITITFSGSIGLNPTANVSEWSGLLNQGPTSTNTNSNTSGSGTVTTNSVTPTNPASLVIAVMGGSGSPTYSSGPTNSFTRMTAPSGSAVVLEGAYQIETSSASYSTGMSWTSSPPWAAAIAAFDSPLAIPKARRRPVNMQ